MINIRFRQLKYKDKYIIVQLQKTNPNSLKQFYSIFQSEHPIKNIPKWDKMEKAPQ